MANGLLKDSKNMGTLKLNTSQLYMLRSTFGKGWPTDLAHHIWERAGGTREEFLALVDAELVVLTTERYIATSQGRKEFDLQRKGHWV